MMEKEAAHHLRSTICAFKMEGVHCYRGISRKVELLPGMCVTIVICDDHFWKLQKRAECIREKLAA